LSVEIERKFLVLSNGWREAQGVYFCQGYLNRDKERTVRVRVASTQAFITIKGLTIGASRAEFEYEIPVEHAEQMLKLCDGPLIEKIRYAVHYHGFCWEIDEFLGDNKGLIIAEIELKSLAQVFEMPSWLGKEVTEDAKYFNSNLAVCPYSSWSEHQDAGEIEELTERAMRYIQTGRFKKGAPEKISGEQSLIILAGTSGGGKTTALNKIYTSKHIRIDADLIREEYGIETYEEAIKKADELLIKSIEEGFSVIHETPFTYFTSIDNAIQSVLSHNGRVHIAFIDITAETSVVRTELSFESGERKHAIIIKNILDEYNHAMPTFMEISKRYDGNSSISISCRDNNSDLKNPTLVFTKGMPIGEYSDDNKIRLIHEETVLSLEKALDNIYTG